MSLSAHERHQLEEIEHAPQHQAPDLDAVRELHPPLSRGYEHGCAEA